MVQDDIDLVRGRRAEVPPQMNGAEAQVAEPGEGTLPVRGVHQAFAGGLFAGAMFAGLAMLTGGRLPGEMGGQPGHTRMRTLDHYYGLTRRDILTGSNAVVADRKLTFDKLTDVFHSSTKHEEDQPCHLLIADTNLCNTRCAEEYGNPCQHFCPAAVYEMQEAKGGGRQIHLNPSNCVHCKTCDIMDPYQIITWVPPEGGGGPSYENL